MAFKIALTARTNAANNFKADFYLSIHHNAGINGDTGTKWSYYPREDLRH